MVKIVTVLAVLTLFVSASFSQTLYSYDRSSLNGSTNVQEPIHIEIGSGDSSRSFDLSRSFGDFKRFLLNPLNISNDLDFPQIDTTKDSLVAEFSTGGLKLRKRNSMNFLITDPPADQISRYLEPFSMIDFNRVNGFFLGLGTGKYIDFGQYDEFGIKGGIGIGFTEDKGQSVIGGEFRIPLSPLRPKEDGVTRKRFISVPTIAIGAEYHNITTTEDHWRAGRLENAVYAFMVREDFRDYFKIDGWNAQIAYRPNKTDEAQIQYRHDDYHDQYQRVYYGRFGGNKRLPENPEITDGKMSSLALTYQAERAATDYTDGHTLFDDEVTIETRKGTSYQVEIEFGDMPDNDMKFQRYIVDVRHFQPVLFGINLDSRLRFESATGDAPIQKLQYLGGPSSLPAYKNKVYAGNRMALLNTEIRINLASLSTLFKNDNVQLLIKNDFGYINTATDSNSIFSGFGGDNSPNILYNIGFGIGHVSGIELGWSWRTDKVEPARFFFRFVRPF